MEINLEYEGKSLFDKRTEKIVLQKYSQMQHHRIEGSGLFGRVYGDHYSATISVKDIDGFQMEYHNEMQRFAREQNIVGYEIPKPEITVQYRIARVFLDFRPHAKANQLGGETWARQRVLSPITEFDRKLSFEKAKSILKRFERS